MDFVKGKKTKKFEKNSFHSFPDLAEKRGHLLNDET